MARFKYVNNELIEITGTELAELESKELEFNNNLFNRALEEVRLKRNNLLAKTDWTDLPSSPLTDEKKSEWQTYRTNLRDITEGITTVEQARAVEFPTKPSGDN